MLIYDLEIKKGIMPKNKKDVIEGIEYCSGWDDHANMGISVLCAYDVNEQKMYSFSNDIGTDFVDGTLDHFKMRIEETDFVVGFNNITFDDVVCRANGIDIPEAKSYDILRSIWQSAGLSTKYNHLTHSGFGLDAVAKAQGVALGKIGSGEHAPILFQRGMFQELVDYCKQDVALTTQVFLSILSKGTIIHPKTGRILTVRSPYEG